MTTNYINSLLTRAFSITGKSGIVADNTVENLIAVGDSSAMKITLTSEDTSYITGNQVKYYSISRLIGHT